MPNVSDVDFSYTGRCNVRSDAAKHAEFTAYFLCGMRYAPAQNRGRDILRSRRGGNIMIHVQRADTKVLSVRDWTLLGLALTLLRS